MGIVIVLLLLFGRIASATAKGDNPEIVKTTPQYFDGWCQEHCSSWDTCNNVFGSNHADLRLRVSFPIDEGPGRHLIQDKYFGSAISRQSFDTQFVLDISTALGTSPCRLHVRDVFPEGTTNYWDGESVFITFRLFPADTNLVATLTRLIQEPNSALYHGHVTRAIDALYGLVALPWDFSMKLTYSISLVGGEEVIVNSEHGRYLNQGSLQTCTNNHGLYCSFEKYLIDDMEMALGLQPGQFRILFIKEADLHSVIVSFRLIPEVSLESIGQDIAWVQSKVLDIIGQISDSGSLLYTGNVSFKVDPTWGISGVSMKPRTFSKFLSRPTLPTSNDSYERCKATHRCPRAWAKYYQSSAEEVFAFQDHRNGEHVHAPLFLDFEDWRRGIRGWEQSCRSTDNSDLCLPASPLEDEKQKKPTGAHWSPFDFDSLGPNVKTFGNNENRGLVLNKELQDKDTKSQTEMIEYYESLISWMDDEFQHSITDDATLRSRQYIRENITLGAISSYTTKIAAETEVLAALTQSQCSNVECSLFFNTSDATLTGAVNATGVIATTTDGTEVAVWSFDSIDIDEHVNVTLTGQRAMALISRSSARINTTLNAIPGTLGGFPGGFSVARRQEDRLVRVCNDQVVSREFLHSCPGDQPISELAKGIKSNNANGPGSPSNRVYLMTVRTSAPVVNEIISVTTSANQGQTLSGGMRLHFNGYSTHFLPHDITASDLKRKMEDSLNPVKRNQLRTFDRMQADHRAGVGRVLVTRETFGSSGGYRWNIEFTTAVGNIGKDSTSLTATNELVAKGARVHVETIRHGNSIDGKFALEFLGNKTRLLNHDVAASELEDILLQDIESLTTASVIRNDPTSNCNDGFCDNGADRSGGYIWTLTLTTQVGNNSPFSPTSAKSGEEGGVSHATALTYLTGCVDSQCPIIEVNMGHALSHNVEMRSIHGRPFSLASGGAGGGYGGHGGDGFGSVPAGRPYGDESITNLYGGSGGAVGVKQPFQLGVFKDPRFRGGSGGGAIEIVADNDIILGSNAVISCNGESGSSGYMSAGGGGSGGTILLAASGAVQIDGNLSIDGGNGGHKRASLPNEKESFGGHGGGGSGGRIAVYG